MCRRTDALTAQHIRNAKAAKWRVNRQALARTTAALVTLGLRTYRFAGTNSGGERAAAIHLLIGIAKLNEVGNVAWLRHLLAQIAEHPRQPD